MGNAKRTVIHIPKAMVGQHLLLFGVRYYLKISLIYSKLLKFFLQQNLIIEMYIYLSAIASQNKVTLVAILMISGKLATLDLLRTKVFSNKGFDIIASFHDITSKILSRDSNYILDVVM